MQTNNQATPWTMFGITLVVAILYNSLFIWLFSSGSNPLPYWGVPLLMSVTHLLGLDLIVECVLMKRPLKTMHETTKTMGIPASLGAAITALMWGLGVEESAILALLIAVGVCIFSLVGYFVRLKRIEKKMKPASSP